MTLTIIIFGLIVPGIVAWAIVRGGALQDRIAHRDDRADAGMPPA